MSDCVSWWSHCFFSSEMNTGNEVTAICNLLQHSSLETGAGSEVEGLVSTFQCCVGMLFGTQRS